MEQIQKPAVVSLLYAAAAVVVVVAGLKAAESIVVPFLLSLFIAIISAPALFALQRRGLPATLSLLVVLVAVGIVAVALALLVGTSVNRFAAAMPEYRARLEDEVSALLQWLDAYGIALPVDSVREALNPSAAMQLASKMLTGLSGVLTNVFFIVLTVIFILLEATSFTDKLRRIMGGADDDIPQFSELSDSINRYIGMKTLTSLATGVLIAIWLALIGVDFPVLWGIFAFLLNFVPTIGSIIAAVPAVLIALVQSGLGLAALGAGGYLVVNVLIGNIIEPRVMGRGLGLSPLVVFLSLVFWGWVLGPVGMLLSVPLTMVVKIMLENSEETRWLAILLGSADSGFKGSGAAAEQVPPSPPTS